MTQTIWNPHTRKWDPYTPFVEIGSNAWHTANAAAPTAPAPAAPVADEYTRETPARTLTIESDVIVPMAQSMWTFFLSGPCWLVLCELLGVHFNYALVLTFLSALLVWVWTLIDGRRLLRVFETIINRDINGDGLIGDEPPLAELPQQKIRIEIPHANGASYRYIKLPQPIVQKLPNVAEAVIGQRAAFSRPELCKRRGLLSQTEYKVLHDAMIKAKFALKNGNNQTELSPAGRAFLRHYLPKEA